MELTTYACTSDAHPHFSLELLAQEAGMDMTTALETIRQVRVRYRDEAVGTFVCAPWAYVFADDALIEQLEWPLSSHVLALFASLDPADQAE